jgi:hypothetical protein
MNKLFYSFSVVLIFLGQGCTTINSVPLPNQDISSLLNFPIGTTFNCKCKYNQTKKHSPCGSMPPYNKARLKNMAVEAHLYAIMSFNAYDDRPQLVIPSWKRIERFETWKGFGADVYLSNNQNDMVIAFRGTDGFTGFNDWIWGNLNFKFWEGQYADADDAFKKIQLIATKYNVANNHIITTGHSLGGGLAMHIALLNNGIDSYVFNPSPRVFAKGKYDKYTNRIVVISESGEVLAAARKVFSTLPKIRHEEYRYNYLGGNFFKEHGMKNFSQCMYKTAKLSEAQYNSECNK